MSHSKLFLRLYLHETDACAENVNWLNPELHVQDKRAGDALKVHLKGWQMGVADLHIHTEWSDGMMSVRALIQHVSSSCVLDVVAITDHDQIGGALEAFRQAAEPGYEGPSIVVGIETTTKWLRHVIGLFFRPPFPVEPLPRFEALEKTVSRIAEFGGIAVVPHPMSVLVPSLHQSDIERFLATAMGPNLVGVEVASGVLGGRRKESAIRAKNVGKWGLAEIGASDAHHLTQVGSALTWFPGVTAADLEAALLARKTKAVWGTVAKVPVAAHVRQVWRAWTETPFRGGRPKPPGMEPRNYSLPGTIGSVTRASSIPRSCTAEANEMNSSSTISVMVGDFAC